MRIGPDRKSTSVKVPNLAIIEFLGSSPPTLTKSSAILNRESSECEVYLTDHEFASSIKSGFIQ